MDMFDIAVGGNQNLEARELLCHVQGNGMSRLRGDLILRGEGLNHVVEHSAAVFVVELLGVQKLPAGGSGEAVDAADQRSALMHGLFHLADVLHDSIHAAGSLGLQGGDEFHDGHYLHRPFRSRSASRELTWAYCSESSRRLTVRIFPMLARVVS